MNNWLDKYENGGSFLGTTNVGRDYSPAWGGQFDMGGSLPGSVGFTYARTGDIPDNGKYAKKTLASAQNGKEMQFYQEGLDFQPKTISRKGSVIKDDRGQWAHPGKDGLELTKLDQLTNWSNYNKSTKGGWLDYYKDGGDIPISSNGVYDYPKQEVIVPTLDGSITMNSIKYPIFGVDEFGNKKIMKPNKNYQFPGRIIHEIPILKNNEKDKRKNSRLYKK
jgi:hypothetical protein